MKIIKKYRFLTFYPIIFFLFQCAKVDPVTGEKILIEPDPVKKARAAADSGSGILGDLVIGRSRRRYRWASFG